MASVGNSSISAQSTATIGNSAAAAESYQGSGTLAARDSSSQHDYQSLSIFDDLPMELMHEFETATVYGKV